MDGTALKVIAMLAMVFDHVGDNFFPGQLWMRAVGRLAMPLFAFCVSEGFCHTRDKTGYLKRLLLFALISEIPFDLVTSGKLLEFGHQNILFTFSWAVIGLMSCDQLQKRVPSRGRYWLVAALLAVFLAASVLLRLDYNMLAVALIFVFYLLREKALWVKTAAGAAIHLLLRNVGIYFFGLLGFLPILLYNGKRGRGLKWLFYIFYPGHLLLIYLIKRLV